MDFSATVKISIIARVSGARQLDLCFIESSYQKQEIYHEDKIMDPSKTVNIKEIPI